MVCNMPGAGQQSQWMSGRLSMCVPTFDNVSDAVLVRQQLEIVLDDSWAVSETGDRGSHDGGMSGSRA